MIYDSFDVAGVCKGCGCATYYYIEGDYPLCNNCMTKLIQDATNILNKAEDNPKVSYSFDINYKEETNAQS